VDYSSIVIINEVSYDYNVADSPIYLDANTLFTTLLPQFCPIKIELLAGQMQAVNQ
jgi:hypothetical protein